MLPASRRWRLVCFDLDGTLVRGTSTCQHIADSFGYGDVLRELESNYAQGTVSNRIVAESDARHYVGRRIEEIAEVMGTIPLIRGIDETVSVLRCQGMHVILGTVTWRFAAKVIAERFKLDAWSGCVMGESAPGILDGAVAAHFDEHDKRAFVETYCAGRGIAMSEVVAVGDSRSDIPLFSAVGYSIAINATKAARQAASCAIDTEDMTDVLKLIPGIVA